MLRKIEFLSVLLCILALSSCGQTSSQSELTPSKVYQNYRTTVAHGITFNQDAAHHSKSKQAEVKQKMDAMQRNSEQSAGQIITLYLKITQQAAKCSELILNEERVDGKTAYLVFDRKDICGDGKIKSAGEEITMVYENGWKIDDAVSIY